MCGIAGVFSAVGRAAPQGTELRSMIGCVRHRGPDESGFYEDDHIGLAHARLSIIDLEGGKQPMHNEDQTVYVIFNGEIFNYKELAVTLAAAGHRFSTRSDTEVIVHAYEEYGLDFVQHLNGQFAIALWDRTQRRLILARDRVGIRPLFYTHADGRLLFASEVKSLFAARGVERRIDHKALAEVMSLWSPVEPRTLFAGVLSLPAGHLMVVAQDGTQTITRYWDWSFPPDADPSDLAIERNAEELRALLIDAVRLRLRADVPVGAYLSGGLDSSIITACIQTFTDTPLRTFSVGFEDAEFDETRYQEELVRHLRTRHTAIRCTRQEIGRAFPSTIWHAESTILRTAPTPLMLLARRVREEGFKVVLTGEGADEVFGGYDLFKEAQIRRFWARQPQSRIRPLLLQSLYPYLEKSPAAAPAFAASFFAQGMEAKNEPYFGHMPRWSTTRRTWRFFSSEMQDAIREWDPVEEVRGTLPAEIMSWRPLCRDQYIEAHTLLTGYLLAAQGDRMAMASSVEGRFPFLDYRVIEFGNRLPVLCKMMGLREKHILKRAMGDLLPTAIARRSKQPYRAPDSQSFFVEGQPLGYVAELLSPESVRKSGLFDPQLVSKLVEKCRSGRAIGFVDNMAFVGILSTLLVDEMFIRQRSIC